MDSSCQISICVTPTGGCLIRVVGRGTVRESPALRQFLGAMLAGGSAVVMDLSFCTYLDSSFLGCLVILHQQGEQHQGSFTVYADASLGRVLFGSSRVDRVLRFAPQLPACLGDPVPLDVTSPDAGELCEHLMATHRKLAELGGPLAELFQRIVERLQRERNQLPP